MITLRLTKYNPKYRDDIGSFKRNEWTSVSYIGKRFDDGVLTLDAYIRAENSYVDAIKYVMDCCEISKLTVSYIEKPELIENDLALRVEAFSWLEEVDEQSILTGVKLERAIRANLRETCFTKLEGDKGSYLHFGYDNYMYFGAECDESCLDLSKFPVGIYLESIPSPLNEYIE